MIDFRLEPDDNPNDRGWQAVLRAAIDRHIDRLAKAEHLAWMDQRVANGWRYGAKRDDPNRVHPLIVDWTSL